MVTVKLALLADYALISSDGKLSIMGIFDRIFAHKRPVIHPNMHLVTIFEAERMDVHRKHAVEVELIDSDGKQVFKLGGELTIAEPPSGHQMRFNHIVNLNNVTFKEFGVYDFKIILDGEVRASVALHVSEAQTKPITLPPSEA